MENTEKQTKPSSISWGQLFIVAGVLILFLYALIVRVNFDKLNKEPVPIEGFTFVGSQIKDYNGTYTELTLPTSYSLGEPVYYSGTATFNNQNQARAFWQEHYAVGAEGYYEFYQELYNHEYPWVYEYNIGKPTYIEGTDIEVNSMAWQICANNQYLEKLTIPAQFTVTNVRAFENCVNLKEVYFEDGVEIVGDGIFDGCTSLEKVRLSETTTRIDAYAFFETAIKEITIPKTVKNFHIGTFYNCKNLEVVRINSPMIAANHNDYYNHFGKCPLRVIYVPYESLNYYKTTSPWSNYASYIRAMY